MCIRPHPIGMWTDVHNRLWKDFSKVKVSSVYFRILGAAKDVIDAYVIEIS